MASKNDELRDLALENIVSNPLPIAGDSISTAWTDLTGVDFRYASSAADAGYAGVIVERYFGADAARAGSETFSDVLQTVYEAWARVRTLLWVLMAAALAMATSRRWRSPTIASMIVGLFVVPVGIVAVAGAPGPRYVAPYEFVAFIAATWLVQVALDRRPRGPR